MPQLQELFDTMDTLPLPTADAMEFDADIAINKMVSYVEPIMLIIRTGSGKCSGIFGRPIIYQERMYIW